MKRKILAMVLALIMVVAMVPFAEAATYTLSADEAKTQVYASTWMNDELKNKFTQVLDTYVPNTNGYESNKRMPGGTYNCAHLAYYTYNSLFGLYYGRDGAKDSYLKLQDYTSVSYEDFVSEGIYPGAHIRTGQNYNTGHSMILLDYNQDYIYIYQSARHPRNGYVWIEVTRYTWDSFNSDEVQRHGKINHISVPKNYDANWKGNGISTPSTLAINPTSEPGEHRDAGAAFYFRGSITSNYNVTSATIQVRGADNASVVMEKTVTPNKTNVDILKDGLDSLKFGSLGEGNYYLWLFAQDSSGKTAEWCVHFSVGYPAEPSKPEPSPEPSAPNCDDGHTWGEWRTVKEASCGVAGQRERVCSVCGAKETATIAALEHDYRVDGVYGNTTYYVCANCGHSYEVTNDPPAPEVSGFPFPSRSYYYDGLFRDVKSSDWFADNVAAAYELGLMKGTGSGTFSPGNNVTLAEAVALAARIHSIYYTGSDSFASYDGGNWYDPYVDYARENNIINTYYNYSRPATREEFIHILSKALPEEALENIAGRVSFADSGEITYMADVRLLSGAGVINGIKENGMTYFKPLNTITRAEVAAVVGRMARPSTRVK